MCVTLHEPDVTRIRRDVSSRLLNHLRSDVEPNHRGAGISEGERRVPGSRTNVQGEGWGLHPGELDHAPQDIGVCVRRAVDVPLRSFAEDVAGAGSVQEVGPC